jgi:hypothetical protein
MNFFRTIVALCCSFAGYRQIADRRWPATLWYLFRLITLLALGLTVALIPRLLTMTDRCADWTDTHAPAFALRDGKVVTTNTQPVVAGTDQFRIVLDTTGTVTQPDTPAAYGLLFNADRFLFWVTNTNGPTPTVQTQSHSLEGFPDGQVNGRYLRQLFRSFLPAGLPVLWIGLTVAGLIAVLVQIIFFTALTALLERTSPYPLPVHQSGNIIAHSVTPAAIIFTVYAALPLHNLDLWLIYLIAYSVFLIGGTTACRAAHSPPTSR